ncbi:RNA polymerase II subunit A C-terminal domain phosphatase [Galdieria sulphuraria]|uniref:RNA polymerase II subunit A C-terminal domain phosphatase n=1 Tax=Galdieria sulphuraria TaxID=130081 RepID=M2XBR6_GALSU|nr:phosphoprotein phosphatase [Galdieria sulphuraria]EME27327.1 phosphoprotein phosphatase [Galdieria sulphuraria]GJD09479.1 RNA polymerase II subunit A C-terminal domain phosphatase [Galdieria sulphuraria]|eukprot:XP_005703847.1 phosphoprotein phosphatase [Galdieria sulphuraria]
MGLCSCLFPITRRHCSSGDKYLLESWLVKTGDQVRPLQVLAVVQGPLEEAKAWKDDREPQSRTEPLCIQTEKKETMELVNLASSNLDFSVILKEYLPSGKDRTSTTAGGQQNTNYWGLRLSEKVTGKVDALVVNQNHVIQPQQMVLSVDVCDHKVQFNGNCALCGIEMDIYSASPILESPREFSTRTDWTLSNKHHLNPAYTHPQLRVSRNELELVEGENTRRLLRRKKLSLVLDLDNTLIHATLVSHFPQEWYQYKQEIYQQATEKALECSAPLMEDIHELDLDGSISLVKLRPNVRRFLEKIHQRYELHIYTMGSRSYADAIATLLDPSGNLFQRRIVSRDDFVEGMMNRKSLRRIFPCDDSMVIIVDDREDVWMDHNQGEMVPNLIRAKPYLFFVQDVHENMNNHLVWDSTTTSIHPSSESHKESFANISTCMLTCLNWKENLESGCYFPYLPWVQKTVESDENYLGRLEQLLIQIHESFFKEMEQCHNVSQTDDSNHVKLPLRDVKLILAEMRHRVLRNCYLSFTGIFRLEESPEVSTVWRLAEEFGAICNKQVTSQTTHLIVDSQRGLHTGKTKYALRRGDIFLVTLEWLETSMQYYIRASELQFALFSTSLSHSYGNDLEEYRKVIEKRHEQFVQNGLCPQKSPSKPSVKRRKMEYSSSEEDNTSTWIDSSSQNNQTKYHQSDDKTSPYHKEQDDHLELEWTASYLASELERELMNDPLCLSGGGESS